MQVAVGYVAAQLVANAAALRELIAAMGRLARSAGHVLDEVYVERSATAPAAFGDLVAHLYGEARALVVPSLHHLTLIDGGLTVQRYLPLADVPLLVARTIGGGRATLYRHLAGDVDDQVVAAEPC